jgi:hypothetical protein
MFRRTGLLVAALVVTTGLATVSAASAAQVSSSASASAPYCGIGWGSQEKTAATAATTPRVLTNIRAGRHDCYDRLVFDVRGGNFSFYDVKYVTTVKHSDGRVVPLHGGAKLSIMVQASDYDLAGWTAYRYANRAELVNVSGYPTFRQVAWADSDRNTTSFGLGVRARLPFRAFMLPGRIVVDVAHTW